MLCRRSVSKRSRAGGDSHHPRGGSAGTASRAAGALALIVALLSAPLGAPATAAVAPALAQVSPPPGMLPDSGEPTPPPAASPDAAATPDAEPTPAEPTATPPPAPTKKPKYTPPPLLLPLRHGTPAPAPTPSGSPKARYTSPPLPHPYASTLPATLPPATEAPATEAPATAAPATAAPATPAPATAPPATPSPEPTQPPATEAPATAPPATPRPRPTVKPSRVRPTPAPTVSPDAAASPTPTDAMPAASPRGAHPTVAPSLPTVPPVVPPTLPPTPIPGGPTGPGGVPGAGSPSAATLIQRAIAEARAETQHPYVTYHLHKKLVVSQAFSQDVAYDVVERASDRLTRFQDVTTGVTRLGQPEPRRPDMPPALWGPDARDVNADVPYATTPSLLDSVHYAARVVGAEPFGASLAYRILLEPHDGGLHDVLRSVLVDGATGRIVEVVTRRVVPLRISIAGKVRDIEIPADVTIDYASIDNSSVISSLRLIGVADGRTADFQYDISDVAFPAGVPDDAFKPVQTGAAVPSAGSAADRIPPIPRIAGTGLTVIALGDSLTVGVGTNVCRGGCVTTPTRPGSGLDVPGAIQDLANALKDAGARLTFVPLGVTGANMGEAPKAEDPGSGDVLANPGQLLALGAAIDAARSRGDRIVVVLWSGSNDVFDAFYANECAAQGGRVAGATTGTLPCASAGTTLTSALGDPSGGSFYRGYLRVVRAIALSKPDAIVAINVEDVSRLPKSLVFAESERRRLSRDVDLANEAIASALRDSAFSTASLVDLAGYANGRPELFSAPYVSVDGVHPSELGYRAIAAAIAQAALGRFTGAP